MMSVEQSKQQLNAALITNGAEYTVAEECSIVDGGVVVPVGSVIRITDVQPPNDNVEGHKGYFTVRFGDQTVLCNFGDAENIIVQA